MSYYTGALPVSTDSLHGSPDGLGANGLGDSFDTALSIAVTASMGASAYHGYKRNNSIGWALWWGLMGGMFPVITPVIALAQGFGKPAGK